MTEIGPKLTAAKARINTFAKAAPDLFEGFSKVTKAATAEAGGFSPAQRELIATAIAVCQGCEDCILYHVEGAKRHGADEAALLAVLEVAVEMGGGPAVMYAGKALETFRAL